VTRDDQQRLNHLFAATMAGIKTAEQYLLELRREVDTLIRKATP